MAKLKLQIEDLYVDSFHTGPDMLRRGTVLGGSDVFDMYVSHAWPPIESRVRSCNATECDATCIRSCEGSCATCEGTCYDPTCWPSSPHVCC
jgi:hypothetical protein